MMLGRSQRSALDQENAHGSSSSTTNHFNSYHHKTPSAAIGKAAMAAGLQPRTIGAKSAGKVMMPAMTGNRTNRILGAKDGNQRAGTVQQSQATFNNNKPAGQSVLFPNKTPGPSKQSSQSVMLSPPPQLVISQPPSLSFRTPSPGTHKFPPLLFSPEDDGVELQGMNDLGSAQMIEAAVSEWDLEEDRPVEYAGGSAADYEEPFETGLPDFQTAGIGAALKAIPILSGDHETWVRQDEEDRLAYRAELDLTEYAREDEEVDVLFDKSKPMFPIPKRKALVSKSSNLSGTSTRSANTKVPLSFSDPAIKRQSAASAAPLRPAVRGSVLAVSSSRSNPPSKHPLAKTFNSTSTASNPAVVSSKTVPLSRPTIASNTPRLGRSSASSTLARIDERQPTRPGETSRGSVRRAPPQPQQQRVTRISNGRLKQSTSAPSSVTSLIGDPEAEKDLGLFGIVSGGGAAGEYVDLLDHGSVEMERDEFRFDDV